VQLRADDLHRIAREVIIEVSTREERSLAEIATEMHTLSLDSTRERICT